MPFSLHCPLLPPSVHCCLLPFCKKMRNGLWAPFPLQYAFLIIFLNKIMKKALLALGALPPPVLISYCSFVVKEWEMLSWLPSLLILITQWLVMISWSLPSSAHNVSYPYPKSDEKCSLGALPCSSAHFLLHLFPPTFLHVWGSFTALLAWRRLKWTKALFIHGRLRMW